MAKWFGQRCADATSTAFAALHPGFFVCFFTRRGEPRDAPGCFLLCNRVFCLFFYARRLMSHVTRRRCVGTADAAQTHHQLLVRRLRICISFGGGVQPTFFFFALQSPVFYYATRLRPVTWRMGAANAGDRDKREALQL